MDFDLFQPEKQIIAQARTRLGDPDHTDLRPAYQALLQDYTRLAKVAARLVRMGDQREEGLKRA
ncbi:MAG: hypothetical protein HQL88_10695, partial [Magnetococcales bacterium]|nr:hypothetical protein [Magnetococcales bacterium]